MRARQIYTKYSTPYSQLNIFSLCCILSIGCVSLRHLDIEMKTVGYAFILQIMRSASFPHASIQTDVRAAQYIFYDTWIHFATVLWIFFFRSVAFLSMCCVKLFYLDIEIKTFFYIPCSCSLYFFTIYPVIQMLERNIFLKLECTATLLAYIYRMDNNGQCLLGVLV